MPERAYSNPAFCAFGDGGRACPGVKFAKAVAKVCCLTTARTHLCVHGIPSDLLLGLRLPQFHYLPRADDRRHRESLHAADRPDPAVPEVHAAADAGTAAAGGAHQPDHGAHTWCEGAGEAAPMTCRAARVWCAMTWKAQGWMVGAATTALPSVCLALAILAYCGKPDVSIVVQL